MWRRGWIVGCSVSCSATISRFVWLLCYLSAYGSNERRENATIREKNMKPINSQTSCRHFDVKARRFGEWFDYFGFWTANARQFSVVSRCVTFILPCGKPALPLCPSWWIFYMNCEHVYQDYQAKAAQKCADCCLLPAPAINQTVLQLWPHSPAHTNFHIHLTRLRWPDK